MTSCPSGLRSHVKAVVLIGAGSNPADVNFPFWSSRVVGVNVGERRTLAYFVGVAGGVP